MEDFDAVVVEFMREYGFTATYVQRTLGEYDPAEGEAPLTEEHTPVQAILLDYTLQSNGFGNKFGTDIMAGDKEMYIQPPNKVDAGVPALNILPTQDTILANGVEYKIVTMKELNTTGGN